MKRIFIILFLLVSAYGSNFVEARNTHTVSSQVLHLGAGTGQSASTLQDTTYYINELDYFELIITACGEPPESTVCLWADTTLLPSNSVGFDTSISGTGCVTETLVFMPGLCDSGSYELNFFTGESCYVAQESSIINVEVADYNYHPDFFYYDGIDAFIGDTSWVRIYARDEDLRNCNDTSTWLSFSSTNLPLGAVLNQDTTTSVLLGWAPQDSNEYLADIIVSDGELSDTLEVYFKGSFPTHKAGDANHDGSISVSDVIYLINYLFKSGPDPIPLAAGDITGDGAVSVSDVVHIINYLFKGGSKGVSCDLDIRGVPDNKEDNDEYEKLMVLGINIDDDNSDSIQDLQQNPVDNEDNLKEIILRPAEGAEVGDVQILSKNTDSVRVWDSPIKYYEIILPAAFDATVETNLWVEGIGASASVLDVEFTLIFTKGYWGGVDKNNFTTPMVTSITGKYTKTDEITATNEHRGKYKNVAKDVKCGLHHYDFTYYNQYTKEYWIANGAEFTGKVKPNNFKQDVSLGRDCEDASFTNNSVWKDHKVYVFKDEGKIPPGNDDSNDGWLHKSLDQNAQVFDIDMPGTYTGRYLSKDKKGNLIIYRTRSNFKEYAWVHDGTKWQRISGFKKWYNAISIGLKAGGDAKKPGDWEHKTDPDITGDNQAGDDWIKLTPDLK